METDKERPAIKFYSDQIIKFIIPMIISEKIEEKVLNHDKVNPSRFDQ